MCKMKKDVVVLAKPIFYKRYVDDACVDAAYDACVDDAYLCRTKSMKDESF